MLKNTPHLPAAAVSKRNSIAVQFGLAPKLEDADGAAVALRLADEEKLSGQWEPRALELGRARAQRKRKTMEA